MFVDKGSGNIKFYFAQNGDWIVVLTFVQIYTKILVFVRFFILFLFLFIASDARKCRAYGRGIQPKGVRTGDVAEFRIFTKDAGEGILKAIVTGPGKDYFVLFIEWINNGKF